MFEGSLWAPYMEKAYAKLHGGYVNLAAGCIQDTLVDLTGSFNNDSITRNDSTRFCL